jgi:PAS domain S-box-containing protein
MFTISSIDEIPSPAKYGSLRVFSELRAASAVTMSVSMPVQPLHILLIEDTPADTRLILDILRSHSFKVTTVERLADALALLRETHVDVILLDLMLADNHDRESLHKEAEGIPIVVLTGNGDEDTALEAIAQGAQDCVVKDEAAAETIVRSIRYAFARSRAQSDLLSSHARFRSLIEDCSDGIALVDREGSILYSNPSIARVLGYSVEEFIGSNHFSLIHPDDVMTARQHFDDAANDGLHLTHKMDLRYRHGDGTWRYLEVVRSNRRGDAANVVSFRDITERHEALDAAEQLRRRYEAILNSIADGVHGIDSMGNISFENAAAETMLGWEAADLIGKRAHETVHHSRPDGTLYSEESCPIMATLSDGIVRHVSDDVFWRRDGTSFAIDYVASPQLSADGQKKGVVVAFRDNTKQNEMQRQIDQAVRVSSLGRVAASIAHEFNNVLMGIQPFAEILSRKFSDDPVMQKPLKHILDGVKRGRTVSHQILRFASPAEPRLARVDLAEWTRHFSEEARLMLGDRQLEVSTTASLIVQADAEQLAQVMLNLITNARDASGTGAIITIGAGNAEGISFLQRRLAEPHRFGAIFVRDRGQGIRPEVLEQIFEPLFTTKKSGGTGLGLAVVHQIVSEHGGKIVVETEPGLGSTFYIALPLKETLLQIPVAGGETATMQEISFPDA